MILQIRRVLSLRTLIFTSFAISVCTILLIFFLTAGDVVSGIQKINPYFVLLAVLAQLTSWVIYGLSQLVMLRPTGLRLNFFRSVRILFVSKFFASITPSYIGGEPLRIYLLHKEGSKVGEAAVVTLFDRIFDTLIFSSILIFTLGAWTGYVFMLIVSILTFYFFLFFIFIHRFEWVSKLILKLSFRWRDRVKKELMTFKDGISSVMREKVIAVGAFALKWVACLASFCVPCIILFGLGIQPNWISLFFAQSLLYLSGFIAITPGGSGIMEALAASLFKITVPASMLGALTLGWRGVTFYLDALIGGVLGLNTIKKYWKKR